VVSGEGQKGALGGGDDGRWLIDQDNLAAGDEHPCAGGAGARRDAERAANRRGAAGANLYPGGHHPAPPACRRAVAGLIQDGGQDTAMNDAGEALEAGVGGELGDDGVALLVEDELEATAIASAAGEALLIGAAVVEAVHLALCWWLLRLSALRRL